ncbi:MAG: hypothetical protein HYT79_12340 [Elusimicrobia bacterium]|nr:hypothetical protein [Elusimicrobiota bacterium]
MKLKIALVGLFLAFGPALYAGFLDSREGYVGTSAGQILKLGIGNAEAMALGRSYVALAEGVESLGFNPAGIARSNNREFALGLVSWIDDFKGHYLGYNHPFMHANFALNAAYMTMGDFDARDENGIPLAGANVFVRTGFTHAGFGWSLPTERLFFGFATKAVYEDFYGNTSTNFAFDGGLLWAGNGGLQLGTSILGLSLDDEKIPWSYRLGASYSFPEFVTVTSDFIQDRDSQARIGTGLVIDLPESEDIGLVSLRVGYFSADDQGESRLGLLKRFKLHRTSGISYGIGIDSQSESLYRMSLDYALVPLGALGTAHHVNLKFRF